MACSARKLGWAAPARFLYTGDLFRASVKWAESWELPWVVLSAAHGVVPPGQVLVPYDVSLTSQATQTDRLIALAAQQLPAHIPGRQGAHDPDLIVLGGKRYVDVVLQAARRARLRTPVQAPLQALPERGLGYYRSWLSINTR